jgi:conjugative transposon TraN protein
MKKVWGLVFGLLLSHLGFSQGFDLVGMPSRSIPVSGTKMTNLVFPVAVETGVKVSHDVLVQRPKGIENVIELKAVRRNFAPTNLSVFGKDGRLYTFDLRYVEDTSVLSFQVVPPSASGYSVMLTSLPVNLARLDSDALSLGFGRPFLRRATRSEGIRLGLSGIYLRDSLMWFCFRVRNATQIGFYPAYLRMFIEDKKKVKRTATQEVDVVPVYPFHLRGIPGQESGSFVVGFVPFAVAKGKRVVVQLADQSGGRSLELVVKERTVLKARK